MSKEVRIDMYLLANHMYSCGLNRNIEVKKTEPPDFSYFYHSGWPKFRKVCLALKVCSFLMNVKPMELFSM